MKKYRVYKYRWVVLAIYMYVTALTQLYWLNFASIDTYVEKNLHLSAMNVGVLALVFPLVYLFLSIPSGIIIDKKGFKYSVGIGAMFTGAFAVLRLINPYSYALLLTSQIGISIGQPFVLNGITKLVVAWFPQREEATAVGIGSLSLFIGMIMALGVTPSLVESIGFRSMLLIYAIMGIIGILLFFMLVRPNPPTPSRKIEEKGEISYWKGIKKIFKIKDFVILGFIALIGIGVFNGLATWLEKILNELHHIPMVKAGSISAMLVLGGVVGCIVIPVISDKIGKRKPFLIVASLVGAASITILIFESSYTINMINAVIMGFFMISALPIMLTMSTEITGGKFAGISVAYLQLLGNGAAVAIVPIMEILRRITDHYILPLVFLIILLCISFIMAILIRETATKARFL